MPDHRRRALLLAMASALIAGIGWWWLVTGLAPEAPLAFDRSDLEGIGPTAEPDAAATGDLSASSARSREDAASPGAGLSLRGRVVDAGGAPLAGASVRWALIDDRGRALRLRRASTTADDGRFAFAGAAPAWPRLVLVVRHPRTAPAVVDRLLVDGERELDLGDVALAPGGTVIGRVTDSSGTPLLGATVSLRPAPGNLLDRAPDWPELLAPLSSDTDGSFRIPRLPPGGYRIEAVAPGALRAGADGPVDVVDGGTIDVGTIRLPPGHRIEGTVQEPNGQPVAGAEVRVRNASPAGRGPLVREVARTGPDGAFLVDHLPDQPLRLEIAAAGFLTWSREPVQPAAAGSIAVRLEEGLSIAGRVVDAGTGEPVPRFRIRVAAVDPDFEIDPAPVLLGSGREADVRDHPDGRFREEGLDAGTFVVVVGAADRVPARSDPFELRPGAPTPELEIRLDRARSLEVVVLAGADGRPVPGARIELRSEVVAESPPVVGVAADVVVAPGGPLLATGTSDAAGRSRFDGLPPRPVVATARREGFLLARSVPITPGLRPEPLRLELTRPAVLFGHVTGAASGTGSVHVMAYGGVGSLHVGLAGPDGSYRIEGLAPGGYLVRAFRGDPRDFLVSRIAPATDPAGLPRAVDVALSAGELRELALPIEVPACGEIEGRVHGEPAPPGGWRVTLLPAPSPPGAPRFVGRHVATGTDVEGRFVLRDVAAADYLLQVAAGGPEAIVRLRRPITVSGGGVMRLDLEISGPEGR